MKMLVIELTFLLAHVRNQNEKKVRILIKKIHKINVKKIIQNECKQKKHKMNVNKKNAK